MLFSEASREWRSIPKWVMFLIRLGFDWPHKEPRTRRIAVVSMPCDSAAAGLIALGALRRRLELDGANDLAEHFQRIEALAVRGGHTFLRRHYDHGCFVVDGKDAAGRLWVKQVPSKSDLRRKIMSRTAAGPIRRIITPGNVTEWRFDGEAPVQVLDGSQIFYDQHYAKLVDQGGTIVASNLVHSDSGVCLAGRVAGESSTQSTMAAIRFKDNDCVVDLSQLLTIQSWSPGMISRLSFFNPRTGQLDRGTRRPLLVVADGDATFLKVVEQSEFQDSDIIGVAHRTIDREKLEELGSRLAGLDQWYARDSQLLGALPAPPRGISMVTLKRR